jgi:hypothetical protein
MAEDSTSTSSPACAASPTLAAVSAAVALAVGALFAFFGVLVASKRSLPTFCRSSSSC